MVAKGFRLLDLDHLSEFLINAIVGVFKTFCYPTNFQDVKNLDIVAQH